MEGSHGGKTAEWRKAASLFQPVNNKVVKKKKKRRPYYLYFELLSVCGH